MNRRNAVVGLSLGVVGLLAVSVSAQAPIVSIEAAGRNGVDYRDMTCVSATTCPGNGSCASKTCIFPSDCPGSTCSAGVCTSNYCTNATSLSKADGDIAAGDEIKVEVFLRRWDTQPLTGACQNGDACNVPTNTCASKHCVNNEDIECTAAITCSNAGVGGDCVPDTCEPYPKVLNFQYKWDVDSFVSSAGAGAGVFDYAEIACTPAQCVTMEGSPNSCACFHGNIFSAFCTCYVAGICDMTTNLCKDAGVGYFEPSRPDFLMVGKNPINVVGYLQDGTGWEYLLVSQADGVVDTIDQQKKYAGSLHLELSTGLFVSGQFNITLDTDPNKTFVADEDVVTLTPLTIEPLFIDLGASPCDTNPCPPLGEECQINQCVPTGATTRICVPTDIEGPCTDDGNPCTLDVCDLGSCTHPPVQCPRGQVCDPSDGMCKLPQGNECTMIVSSNPPNCEIDAGQPHPVNNAAAIQGWTSVELTFNPECSGLTAGDFSVSLAPGGPAVPTIANVSGAANVVTVNFTAPIPTNQWTCVMHDDSGAEVCLGFLPGDVNASRGTNVQDITALIDSLNNVVVRPLFATDCNRSGAANVQDITAVIDLLNGAEAFNPWNAQTISVTCPTAP